LVSADKGIVIFDLIEGNDVDQYDLRQDDSANKVEARLKTHRELMERRKLLVPIHTLSFAPGVNDLQRCTEDEYPLANADTLLDELNKFEWLDRSSNTYAAVLSALQSISTIRQSRTKRILNKKDSRGAKLKRLEDSIATLDNLQSKAVLETVNRVQRIRGLAGSGKTIVLALKAAYLHTQHQKWRIAVTFNTRSLKGQFRRLITSFFLEQTGEEPDWENLRIISAWGAQGGGEREGIYYEFCRANDVEYLDYRSALNRFGRNAEFTGACELALGLKQEPSPRYDAILVDEAQDFPPAFLRLCYKLLDDNKRLVYAYDELQSLAGESLPSPEDIFGKKPDDTAKVQFDSPGSDIILEKCYRNSRPVLVTAHALGFGIYRNPPNANSPGLVQMFDHPQLWQEIGYKTKRGSLKPNSRVTLCRTEESSPKFLEEHSPIDDLVKFIHFESEEEQEKWLTDAIKYNLEDDELRHDDIVVINPDPRTTRQRVGPIRRHLLEMGINSHLAGVDTNPDIFFTPEYESVTFTGIYRAKGNEAGMIYIVNAQDCHSAAWNLASIRNRLFTAITRSKAWVRVLGVGIDMKRLIQEFEQLKAKDFELNFTYPTKEQLEHLKVVHRDVTSGERKRLKDQSKSLQNLIEDLESGAIHTEDLDEDLRDKLKKHFLKGESTGQ